MVEDSIDREPSRLGALEVAEFVGRNLRVLLIGGLTGGLLLALSSFVIRTTFTSTAVIAPDNQGLQGGALAGLAGEFGLTLPGAAGMTPPALFVTMLKSDQLLQAVVGTHYHAIADSTLVDRKAGTVFAQLGFGSPPLGAQIKSATLDLLSNLQVSADPETGAVELDITASGPELAREIASRALEVLDSFELEAKQRQGTLERRFYESRLKEAADSLKSASTRVATFLERNRAIGSSPWLQFQLDGLQRAVTAQQALSDAMRQSYETSRLSAILSIPSFLTIQLPNLPALRDSRHTVIKGLIGGVFGGLLAASWALVLEWWRSVVVTDPVRADAIRQLYAFRRKRFDRP